MFVEAARALADQLSLDMLKQGLLYHSRSIFLVFFSDILPGGLRAATYTHGNIVERRAFTINIPSEKYLKDVDYVGLVSGRDTDKLSAAKLTAIKSELVDAPYVKEFPIVLECSLRHTIELGLHTQFIGEILDAKADEAILANELPDIKKVNPILYTPLTRKYYGVGSYLGEAHAVGKQL